MSKVLKNTFNIAPKNYTKTIISDLQESWEWLKDETIKEYIEKNCTEGK